MTSEACSEAKTCNRGHPLTPADSYADAKGTLCCRVCHRLRGKAQNAKRKAARQARLNLDRVSLIEGNTHLAWWFVDRFFPGLPNADRDDAIGEALLGVIRAAKDFDPSRATFSTHARWWMMSFVNHWFANRGKRRPRPISDCQSDDGLEPSAPAAPDILTNREEVQRFRRLCRPLDWTCLWRWSQGDSLRAIAADLGITAEWVKQRVNRARDTIRWHELKAEREETRR